jgi:hypothetical protein
MTRKRLWSLTALACGLLLVPSIPRMSVPRIHLADLAPRLAPLHLPLPTMPAPGVAGVGALWVTLLLTLIVVRRRRTPADLAVSLARRGRPVAAIARQTRLSQDAIRDLLGGEPMAVSTARWGRFFRRGPKAGAGEGASFADELKEKSFDARA